MVIVAVFFNFVEHLQQRQHDSDEEVRMDVVQAVVGAAKRSLANIPGELLDSVRERTLDKKVCVPFNCLSWFLTPSIYSFLVCHKWPTVLSVMEPLSCAYYICDLTISSFHR